LRYTDPDRSQTVDSKAACPERAERVAFGVAQGDLERSRKVEGRDVRVVEGARLENDCGEAHTATTKQFVAQSIQRLDALKCDLM